MPTEAPQRSIDKHWERKAKMIAIANKKYTCGENYKYIVKELQGRIQSGKCDGDCIEEIKGYIEDVKKNCGPKKAKKFEKDIGIKLEDNMVLKF